MAKNYVYFKGKGSWFQHLFILDDKFGDPKWSVKLHFTPESLEEFRGLKLKTHLKKDDDGYYATLSRRQRKVTRAGKEIIWEHPQVFDKDGIPMTSADRIGNGSDITVKCEVYQYRPQPSAPLENAIRLESVRIDNQVPYEPTRDYTPEQEKAAEGLRDQPEPLF